MNKHNNQREEVYSLELKLHQNGCMKWMGKKYRPVYSKPMPSLTERASMAATATESLKKYMESNPFHPEKIIVRLHEYGIGTTIFP